MTINKEKRPLTKEESRMLFEYFHNKSSEDIAEAEYQEFMESDFFQEEVAEHIEEWTSLSYQEIEKIREDVGAEYEEEFMESDFLEEVVAKRIKEEGRTISNEDIKKIREDVLDVDDCLSQHRDAKRPGEKIDEAIVKPLFLKEYGIKLS